MASVGGTHQGLVVEVGRLRVACQKPHQLVRLLRVGLRPGTTGHETGRLPVEHQVDVCGVTRMMKQVLGPGSAGLDVIVQLLHGLSKVKASLTL